MKKVSHQIIGITTAYVLGFPIFPAFISSTLPDLDVYFRNKKGGLLFSHRGITHHALLVLILTLLLLLIQNIVIKSILIGYISHLIADVLTTSGIPYWTNKHRLSLNLFKTGSIGEYIFISSSLIIIVVVFIVTLSLIHI